MPAASLLPPENLVGATEVLLKIVADKLNLPELEILLPHLMGAPGGSPGGGQSEAGAAKPPETTRNYVRHNIPGGSRSQKENVLAQALLGQKSQPSEMATVGR